MKIRSKNSILLPFQGLQLTPQTFQHGISVNVKKQNLESSCYLP